MCFVKPQLTFELLRLSVFNPCLLWCDLPDSCTVWECVNERSEACGFSWLAPHAERSKWELALFRKCFRSFFLSFFLDYISGLLDCLCFLWRDQNGHAALDGTDKKTKKPKSCWVFGKWTQRPRSSLSRGWKSSSLLAQCDITCLNYYHRNNSDVISFTLLNWLTLWRGLIRMW